MSRLEIKGSGMDVLKDNIDSVETSSTYISDQFDQWTKDKQWIRIEILRCYENKSKIRLQLLRDIQRITYALESMVDRRCRSMRDNLIFTGIAENTTSGKPENTETLLKSFIKGGNGGGGRHLI